ncbi:MAG: cell division protein ZapA [Bacteroidales bacterium]|jgi:hypothetical protein|nr:cell division protein ZapA [Bacteroidales bacterium]
MEDDKIKIKLAVADRFVEVVINKEWEYYYREAEKIINESFLRFAKNWAYTDHQDLLSKILVDFAVKWVENEERLNDYDEDLVPKMQELNKLADNFEND